jgi:hypothetical protein
LKVSISGNGVWIRRRQPGDEQNMWMAAPAAIGIPNPPPAEPDAFFAPAVHPVPMPLAAFESGPAEEMASQSYPRRAKLESLPPPEEDFAPMAPVADPVVFSQGPVPLMKALSPPPPEPVSPAPISVMPSSFSNQAMAPVTAPPGTVSAPMSDPVSGAAPAMDPFEIHFWQAEQGSSLKQVLDQWAGMAGVTVVWNTPYDYALPSRVKMHGTFANAVTNALMSYGSSDPRPLGRLHPNLPTGPSVLVIEHYSLVTN